MLKLSGVALAALGIPYVLICFCFGSLGNFVLSACKEHRILTTRTHNAHPTKDMSRQIQQLSWNAPLPRPDQPPRRARPASNLPWGQGAATGRECAAKPLQLRLRRSWPRYPGLQAPFL